MRRWCAERPCWSGRLRRPACEQDWSRPPPRAVDWSPDRRSRRRQERSSSRPLTTPASAVGWLVRAPLHPDRSVRSPTWRRTPPARWPRSWARAPSTRCCPCCSTSCARPTLLVIEDLQWADEATLDLVVLLARRMGTTRSLAVVPCRDDELSADHPLRLVLGGLAAAGVERLRLSPLSIDAVRELSASHQVDTGRALPQNRRQPLLRDRGAGCGWVGAATVGSAMPWWPAPPARPAGPCAARGCVDRARHGAARTGDRAGLRARRPARHLPRVRDARRVEGQDLLPARPRPCRHRRRDRAATPRRTAPDRARHAAVPGRRRGPAGAPCRGGG